MSGILTENDSDLNNEIDLFICLTKDSFSYFSDSEIPRATGAKQNKRDQKTLSFLFTASTIQEERASKTVLRAALGILTEIFTDLSKQSKDYANIVDGCSDGISVKGKL